MIEGQNPRDQLLVIQVPNARDQIAFYAVHSLVVDVQMLATYTPRMRNSNLELSISSNQGKTNCGRDSYLCVRVSSENVCDVTWIERENEASSLREILWQRKWSDIYSPPPPQKKWLFFRRHLCFFTTMLAAKNCTHIKLAHFREQGNLSPCSRLLISLHLHESLVSEPCVSCKYLFLAAAAVPKD